MTLVVPAFSRAPSLGVGSRLEAQENDAPKATLADQRIELSRLQRKLQHLRAQATEARKSQVERWDQSATSTRPASPITTSHQSWS